MALQSSGTSISFSQIANEFGYPTDNKLGNYRIDQDVGELGELPLDTGVPQSGTIKFSDFYSKKLNIVVDCHSGGTESGGTNAKNDKWNNDSLTVIGGFRGKRQNGSRVIIHVDKIFRSRRDSDQQVCALRTGSFNSEVSSLEIDVSHEARIYGAGGKGGDGASISSDSTATEAGEPGGNGNSALGVEFNGTIVRVANGGLITKGYGGGGGGGCANDEDEDGYPDRGACGGGGGGGAGNPGGARGNRGERLSGNEDEVKTGNHGTAGGTTTAGQGGEAVENTGAGAFAYGGAGGRGADSEQTAQAGGDGNTDFGTDDEGSLTEGGAVGGNGAAIRRSSGISVTISDPGNGITGSTTATGVN